MIGERRLGDVDSSIESLSQIILQHRLTVQRHNAPFKCQNISDEPLPFSYFESTSFCKSLVFIVTRQSYELMYMMFCRMSNGEYFEKEFNSLG